MIGVTSPRPLVFWWGNEPGEAEGREFVNRSLTIRANPAEPPDFNIARGAIFSTVGGDAEKIGVALKAHVANALNYGLAVYVVAGTDTELQALESYLPPVVSKIVKQSEDPATAAVVPYVRRVGGYASYEFAEGLARHDPGPAANLLLKMTAPAEPALDDETVLLLKRAFGDSKEISLAHISGGASASVFEAQITPADIAVGARILPYFVKIDLRHKIHKEKRAYEQYTTQFIPWYLRPNLEPRRCIAGVTKGLLIGSFVEQSVSLLQAAQEGRGERYIHALFEDTLRGWRHRETEPRTGIIGIDTLSDLFKWSNIQKPYVDFARHSLGSVLRPTELRAILRGVKHHSWIDAPMHGDMHGENVRVRHNDAIVIDLTSVNSGPLTADLASLEVFLSSHVSGGDVAANKAPSRDRWTEMMHGLYAPTSINQMPPADATRNCGKWLAGCVRQIRMIAYATCGRAEYLTTVALYLLRWATFDSANDEERYRRAVCYFLAENLILSLERKAATV